MTLTIKPDDFSKYTPVMQQYLNARYEIKDNALLFFRMGDFYETFFEDAEIAARELEITLTGRPESNYPGGRIPMAGVPAKAMEPYAARLLERGYKVCIAEQMADPSKCKGLVPREVTKVLTPGTINELNLLNSYQNNFIAAVYADPKKDKKIFLDKESKYGLAYADITTGEFYVTELKQAQLNQELARINPAEIILPSQRSKVKDGELVARDELFFELELSEKVLISKLDKKSFAYDLAEENLVKRFNVKSLDGFGLSADSKFAVQAAGAILEYLKETQKDQTINFDTVRAYQISEYMLLDASTRRNLELVKTTLGAYDGSLMHAIDRTFSNIGRRRLRTWLEQPLYDQAAITSRQDAVKELFDSSEIRFKLREILNKIYDIERLASRLANESINPRELASLKESLLLVPEISITLENCKAKHLIAAKEVPSEVLEFVGAVELALLENPPNTITEGNIICHGYNDELDEYLTLVNDSQTWLKNYEEGERSNSGIKNLKVNFNKVHGYFLEVSKSNLKLVPEAYVCKQTMVNSSRFVTSELKEFEEKITNAESRRNSLEHALFVALRKNLAVMAPVIKKVASNIANLDALLSLAIIADEQNYSCPHVDESSELMIKDGRHPVVEQKLQLGSFVPNDIELNSDKQVMVLTGPNMAGKSTFMRQNALVILLAQIGSFVPATEAKIGLVDRIFTRIGASDDLSSGQSTFMVEMNETAAILNGMTANSFIVLDEIGRGTSTYDGVAIAWAVIEYISKLEGARTIFATHYHELADLETLFTNIVNYQMLVSENKDPQGKTAIEFLHKVAPGSADRSYGIEVARLAGVPQVVLKRARSINSQLQSRDNTLASKKKVKEAAQKAISKDGELVMSNLPLFNQPQ